MNPAALGEHGQQSQGRRARARVIVRLASKKAEELKAEGIAQWFWLDERGKWEATALAELARVDRVVTERPELAMTDDALDDALADMLLLLAVEAINRSRGKVP